MGSAVVLWATPLRPARTAPAPSPQASPAHPPGSPGCSGWRQRRGRRLRAAARTGLGSRECWISAPETSARDRGPGLGTSASGLSLSPPQPPPPPPPAGQSGFRAMTHPGGLGPQHVQRGRGVGPQLQPHGPREQQALPQAHAAPRPRGPARRPPAGSRHVVGGVLRGPRGGRQT